MNKSRPRNAAATRDAILASARACFARTGYDGSGVREIAAGAGVTAMLVNRYFGSKEQLFAEAVAASMADPIILAGSNLASPDVAGMIAETLMDITRANHAVLEGFQMMLKSAASERAAEIGREQIEQGHQRLLTEALSGDLAPERAALALALVAGFQIMRQMIGLSALTDGDPEALKRLLAGLFAQLLYAGTNPSG